MHRQTVTAGLVIVLSLCVMGTAILSYYHVLLTRDLNRANYQIRSLQQQQTRVNALLREALHYSRTHEELLPVLKSAGVNLPNSPEDTPAEPPDSNHDQ